jgi:DNA replication protein DnaC
MKDPTQAGDMLHHIFPIPPDHVLDEIEAKAREVSAAEQRALSRDTRRKNLIETRPPVHAPDMERLIADDLQPTRSLRAVREWLAGPESVVLLTGTLGVGKTLAGAWMLARCGGLYVRAERACGVFSARFGPQVDEQDRWKRLDHLVLDEIGTERDPALMGSTLLELVDERRYWGQKTILIGNLLVEDFRARYDDPRLWSRIQQCGQVVTDKSADLRGAP